MARFRTKAAIIISLVTVGLVFISYLHSEAVNKIFDGILKYASSDNHTASEANMIFESLDISNYSLSQIEKIYHSNFLIIEGRVKQRMKRIHELCGNQNHNIHNIYAFNQLGISWCPVFKSGSSTWKDYFIEKNVNAHLPRPWYLDVLTPFKLKGENSEIVGKRLYTNEFIRNLRFTVVRDPFARLVSHMQSTLRPLELYNQRDGWIKSAIVASRKHKSNPDKDNIYLEELKEYYDKVNTTDSVHISDNNPYLHPPYPEFNELIDHIIWRKASGMYYDGHWAPASEWCDVCINRIDYIVKLEGGPLELLYLIQKLGLWEDRIYFFSRHNSSGNKSASRAVLETYRQMLSVPQRVFLNSVFESDMELFDYPTI